MAEILDVRWQIQMPVRAMRMPSLEFEAAMASALTLTMRKKLKCHVTANNLRAHREEDTACTRLRTARMSESAGVIPRGATVAPNLPRRAHRCCESCCTDSTCSQRPLMHRILFHVSRKLGRVLSHQYVPEVSVHSTKIAAHMLRL